MNAGFRSIAAASGLALAMVACGVGDPSAHYSVQDGSAVALPAIGHVFVIVMENENYAGTFGANPGSPYLGKTLTGMGALLTQYYGIGHVSLDNYIAMVSGQAPNPVTQSDCQNFTEFSGTVPPGSTDGQAVGSGCVYPTEVETIGDQLEAAGFSWRQYAEDMALGPNSGMTATCRHPVLGRQDSTQTATASDQYATRHVPFVYFHSIIDDQPRCDGHVVDLGVLDADLNSVATTPNLVFITPDLCSDGHDATCANSAQAGGYAGIEDFLKTWIPKITSSPAYQQDGMILIIFDEAANTDASACCNEQSGPNSPSPGISGAGGGRVGAVVLSQFTRPGSVSNAGYNHYSLLRSIEDLFGLAHLGYAGQAGLQGFGDDVYSAR